jgi:hypothetical protein
MWNLGWWEYEWLKYNRVMIRVSWCIEWLILRNRIDKYVCNNWIIYIFYEDEVVL